MKSRGQEFSQCFDRGFREKGHESQFDPVSFQEAFFVFASNRHDRLHINLVERRQQRSGLLSLDKAGRDGPAEHTKRFDLFFAV